MGLHRFISDVIETTYGNDFCLPVSFVTLLLLFTSFGYVPPEIWPVVRDVIRDVMPRPETLLSECDPFARPDRKSRRPLPADTFPSSPLSPSLVLRGWRIFDGHRGQDWCPSTPW